jgi:hypothetical protein
MPYGYMGLSKIGTSFSRYQRKFYKLLDQAMH